MERKSGPKNVTSFLEFFEQNKHVKTLVIPEEEMEDKDEQLTWLQFLQEDEKTNNDSTKGKQICSNLKRESSSQSTETSLLGFLLEIHQDANKDKKNKVLQLLTETEDPAFAKSEETQSLIEFLQQPCEEPDPAAVVETLHLILTPKK